MQIRKLRDPRAHDWDERVLPALQERVLDLVLMPSQVTIYSLEEDKRDDVLDGVDHAMLESIIRSLKIKYVQFTCWLFDNTLTVTVSGTSILRAKSSRSHMNCF